jgi:FAD/FMN-containing dehydrogenase
MPSCRRPWCVLVTVLAACPAGLFVSARAAGQDGGRLKPTAVNDASHLNRTEVAGVWKVPSDPDAAERQLREVLQQARTRKLRVSIAGATHSMGGHTMYPGGIVLDMLPFNRMKLDRRAKLLHVGAGARWSEIIPHLEDRDFSVAVMQSNNSFSVGGSLSVNCHGWQPNRPPIASTVEAFRLMKADGAVVRCSRTENPELFALVLGGYGLFGIILDVDLRVVPNERYTLERVLLPRAEDYAAEFRKRVAEAPDVAMAYGRLCVVPGEDTFLREAILNVFHRAPCPPDEIPGLSQPGLLALKRAVFRGSVYGDTGKWLRWEAEKRLGGEARGKHFSRNQLLNEGVEVFQERSEQRTDILHEYFVPPEQVPAFLRRLRAILPAHHANLLNVTVRDVRRDEDAFLRYAERDVFGFVMLFSQLRTAQAEKEMEALTRELTDAVIGVGGRYYLPYRLHATPEQFDQAYPQGREFFRRKRQHDPEELFQNDFYRKYGRP